MIKPRFWLISVIILVFFIAACGGSSDEEGGLQSSNNTSVSSDINNDTDTPADVNDNDSGETIPTSFSSAPSITTNEFIIPEIEELEGTLVFVQGDMNKDDLLRGTGGTLYVAQFDGSTPQPMTERVFASTLSLSPDNRYVVFNANEGRRRYVYSLEIATGEVQQLARMSNQFAFVNSWSPDVEWITLTPFQQGVIVAKLDGTGSFELDPGNIFWTTDGQVVYFEIDNFFQFNNPNPPELASIQLIDPDTTESTVLDIEFDPTDTSLTNLIANAEAAGIDVAPTFHGITNFPGTYLTEDERILTVQGVTPPDPDAFFNTPPHCGQWQMSFAGTSNTEQDLFVDVLDTALISDIYQAEETFFYERWYLRNCDLSDGNLVMALESIVPGEERQVITEDVYATPDVNLGFLRGSAGRRYAVSPDQQYVAWISGSLETSTTRINVTHIASGETITVLEWSASDQNTFLATEALNAIFWVPTQ